MAAAPKEANPNLWCFASSPKGKKCLGRIGHKDDHAAYSQAREPFEVWPTEATR